MGHTEGGKIRVHLGHALNFRDATVQFLCGSVKLISHCISGIVGMTMVYSLSGSDPEETPSRPEDGVPSGSASASAMEDEDTVERRRIVPDDPDQEGRFARATPRNISGVVGQLPPGRTLAERLEIINRELNKDYKRGKTQKYGKISNWPVTCTRTREGFIRYVIIHLRLRLQLVAPDGVRAHAVRQGLA